MRRIKLLILVAAILVIPGSALGVLISNQLVFFARPMLATSSPRGTYRVTMLGKSDVPSIPLLMHNVWFSVDKNDTRIVKEKSFYSGDWFDPSFGMLYSNQSWQAENILHFYRDGYFPDGKPSTVLITNTSAKTIKYLRLTSLDVYLLFDLPPGSKTELSLSPPRSSTMFLSVEGAFLDDSPVVKIAENFKTPHQPSGTVDYSIRITDTGVSVDSPSFEVLR